MRVFQFLYCYPGYYAYFDRKYPSAAAKRFKDRLHLLLEHHVNAVHILEPVYRNDPDVFVTMANDQILQTQWAKEHGMTSRDLTDILLAQIEEHRPEVVYNLYPIQWNSAFMKRLPGCVKKKVCWRAAPIDFSDLKDFDLLLCNFPPFLQKCKTQGLKAAYFNPSYDPQMSDFAVREDRPIDISFVGTYSNAHRKRNKVLESCAALSDRYRVAFGLLHPERKPLLNIPLIRRIPGLFHYLPESLRKIAIPPVYGLELYELFAKSKIVINASIDMAGQYRGNMRCFEAMGCGACMLSDEGIYPDGFMAGIHFQTFKSAEDAISKIKILLGDPNMARAFGMAGSKNLEANFSKITQWNRFCECIANI